MKKKISRQARTRLQTLGTAQLAQIAGGVTAVEYCGGVIAAVTVAVLDTLAPRW